MLKVCVWNMSKVNMCGGISQEAGESDYDYLLRAEANGSLSTTIEVNDVAQFREFYNAVWNETDVEFSYQFLDENNQPTPEPAEEEKAA